MGSKASQAHSIHIHLASQTLISLNQPLEIRQGVEYVCKQHNRAATARSTAMNRHVVAMSLLLLLLMLVGRSMAARQLQQASQEVVQSDNPPTSTNNAVDPFDAKYDMAEDELLVQLRLGAKDKKASLAKGKASEKKVIRASNVFDGKGDLIVVKVDLAKIKLDMPDQATADDRQALKLAGSMLKSDADIEFAEPNYKLSVAESLPNDPKFVSGSGLWGMKSSSMCAGGSNAEGAWAAGFTDCSGVTIGVIDQGIQVSHPDLQANIWINPGETAGNGQDEDGSGYADDIYGWDFFNNDASVFDGNRKAGYDNHGTHVSGTIGGVGYNGLGIVGVCPTGIKLVSAKFLGPSGGYLSDAVEALNYLLRLKQNHSLNMVATSNSWGGGGYSQALYDAIKAHCDAGILFIAAAGNDGLNTDTSVSYPAGYNLTNVISVGSINCTGQPSSFSNYGAASVDIFAPGSSIESTVPVNSYAIYSGTSMATPHVSGAAALYAAGHKKCKGFWPSHTQVKNAIYDNGKDNSNLVGLCVTGRQLDVGAMLVNMQSGGCNPPPPPLPTTNYMKIQVSVTITHNNARVSRATAFTCTFQWTVVDTATGAAVPNPFITASVAVDPDNINTDKSNVFPVTVSDVDMGTTGIYSYITPPIPTKNAIRTTGTACVMNVVSLTHATYTLDPASSMMDYTTGKY